MLDLDDIKLVKAQLQKHIGKKQQHVSGLEQALGTSHEDFYDEDELLEGGQSKGMYKNAASVGILGGGGVISS